MELKSENMRSVTYQVIAHGKIFYASNIRMSNMKCHFITFNATFDLFPKATLIAYFFENDDIVAKSIDISIDKDFRNFIKMNLSRTEIQPGKDVKIDINTNPVSRVGIVGVDQSVILQRKNDGLTKEDIIQELNEYQNDLHEKIISAPSEDDFREYDNEYFEPFKNNNLILFTNARKDIYYEYSHDELDMRDELPVSEPFLRIIRHKIITL